MKFICNVFWIIVYLLFFPRMILGLVGAEGTAKNLIGVYFLLFIIIFIFIMLSPSKPNTYIKDEDLYKDKYEYDNDDESTERVTLSDVISSYHETARSLISKGSVKATIKYTEPEKCNEEERNTISIEIKFR